MEANKTIPSDKSIYISKCLADKYYKKANPIGKTIKIGGRDSLTRVAGVFSDVQTKNENVPDFLAISQDKLDSTSVKGFFSLCFRIKPDVDEKTFEEHFRRDIAPRLSVGNYYMMHLQSLKEIRKGYEKVYIINRFVLHYVDVGVLSALHVHRHGGHLLDTLQQPPWRNRHHEVDGRFAV
jgi:hypothetical protein